MLKEFEAVELNGSIAAELPVIIEGGRISILDGTLTGEPPGGVIRYQPSDLTTDDDTSALGIVADALSNFEYDSITSAVDYSEDGDLVLQMRIEGRNPDLEGNRPVVLNLGIENNIPQMLKSLQAARCRRRDPAKTASYHSDGSRYPDGHFTWGKLDRSIYKEYGTQK